LSYYACNGVNLAEQSNIFEKKKFCKIY